MMLCARGMKHIFFLSFFFFFFVSRLISNSVKVVDKARESEGGRARTPDWPPVVEPQSELVLSSCFLAELLPKYLSLSLQGPQMAIWSTDSCHFVFECGSFSASSAQFVL